MGISKGFVFAVLVFISGFFVSPLSAAENDPQAVALLQKVTDVYKNAASFSCEGQYQSDLQTKMPVKQMGAFKILFSRPDMLRVDWSETAMGGQVSTNSIFTQDKVIYFYWEQMGKWAPQKDMEFTMGANAGISHGISYAVPSLLLGKTGYLQFVSLKPLAKTAVSGVNCVLLSGETKFQGEMELAVDPASYAIRQIKTTKLIRPSEMAKEMAKTRKELAKTNPALAAKMVDSPVGPDFTAVQVTTYKNPVFGKELTAAEFVYPVPASAKKVDDVLK